MDGNISRAEDHLREIEDVFPSSALQSYEPVISDESPIEPIVRELGDEELISVEDWKSGDLDSAGRSGPDIYADQRRIRGAIGDLGIEALAFYKSARYINRRPFPGSWGIFYLRDALDYLGDCLCSLGMSSKDSKDLSHEFIWRHEFFHFKTDMAISFLEAGPFVPLYTPLSLAFTDFGHLCVEEALANRAAFVFTGSISNQSVKSFFTNLMDLQPGEYAKYRLGLNRLQLGFADQIVASSSYSRQFDNNFSQQIAPILSYPPSHFAKKSSCPQHVVVRSTGTSLYGRFDLPKVDLIVDSDRVKKDLKKKPELNARWQVQKQKLLADSQLVGLGFKKWPRGGKGMWSVKVDDGHRAHIEKPTLHGEPWTTVDIGTHTQMGHG